MNEKTETSSNPEKTGQRIDPILEHLEVEGAEVDKDLIRKRFIDIWEYEKGDELDEEEQWPMAQGMLQSLCSGDIQLEKEALETATQSLESRVTFWNSVEAQM